MLAKPLDTSQQVVVLQGGFDILIVDLPKDLPISNISSLSVALPE
jgi:hypothetical protein